MPGWVLVSSRIEPGEAARLVPAEVGAADAAAAERAVGAQRVVEAGRLDLGRDVGRDDVARAAGGVLGVVVVPAVGDDVGDRQRPVAHHRRGQLAAGDVLLDHHHVGHVVAELRRAVGALEHDVDADRGALVVRLHHVGRRHRVAPRAPRRWQTSRPVGTGRPAAAKIALARSLSMASAEASTPEWV